MSQHYRPEIVAPLLQAAAQGRKEEQAVVAALETWRTQPIPALLEALALPDSSAFARTLAARRLAELGPPALAALNQTLARIEPDAPAAVTVPKAITRLQHYHAANRARLRAELYSEGLAQLKIGDCDGAVQRFDEGWKLAPFPEADLVRMAEAYACAGHRLRAIELLHLRLASNPDDAAAGSSVSSLLLAEADDLEAGAQRAEAIALLADSLLWWPSSATAERLAHLWVNEGSDLASAAQWRTAWAAYNKALEIAPGYEPARLEAGKAVARREWFMVLVALVGPLIVGVMVRRAQQTAFSPEKS